MESFSRKDIKLINAQAFKYIFKRERERERERDREREEGIVLTRQTHGIWNIAVAFDNITSDP
jgi:hypothetical protein